MSNDIDDSVIHVTITIEAEYARDTVPEDFKEHLQDRLDYEINLNELLVGYDSPADLYAATWKTEVHDPVEVALHETRKSIYRGGPTFSCPDCGSHKVEATAWIDPNTDEVLRGGTEGPVDIFWCKDCDAEIATLHVDP